MQTMREKIMNTMQQEQLFTDLTPAQAETTAGGKPFDDGNTPTDSESFALASYGSADTSIFNLGGGSISFNMLVKDRAKDGQPVYAKFEGIGIDGRSLIGSSKFFDFRGAAGSGTIHIRNASFGKTVSLIKARVWIHRKGRSPVAGDWVNF